MYSASFKKCRLAVVLLLLVVLLCGCRGATAPTPSEMTDQVTQKLTGVELKPLSGTALNSYFEFQDTEVNRFSVFVSASASSADTVAAFEARDDKQQNAVISGISGYLSKLSSSFKNTMDSEYQKIQNRVLVQIDQTVLLVICSDTSVVEPLLENWGAQPIY